MRLGLLASAFDPYPHPGIIWAIEQAVASCKLDGIIAAVHVDPSIERPAKRSPSTPLEERLCMVRALKWVWRAFPYHTEKGLRCAMQAWQPDVVIIGEDHRSDDWTGKDLGLPVFWAKRKEGWSGTEFVRRIREGS